MRERISRFMHGRYGIDSYSNFLVVLALILMAAEILIPVTVVRSVLGVLGILCLAYSYVRILSRNSRKRYEENERFLKRTEVFRKMVTRWKSRMAQRRTHHIYKCPSCRQAIRIPKGKGKIAITCPKCQNEFIRRS